MIFISPMSGGTRLKHARIASLIALGLLAGCQRPTQLLPPAPLFDTHQVSEPRIQTTSAGASADDFVRFSGATTIYFEPGAIDLSEEARRILDIQAAWLREYPAVQVSLQGHADAFGTRQHQLVLGARRASAMKLYLAARGVAVGRLSVTSFGKEKPAMRGLDEASQKLNRRGETVMLGVLGASGN